MTVQPQTADLTKSPQLEAFLAGATRIAHHLSSQAIWFQGRCSWITDDADGKQGELAPFSRTLSSSYYDGTLGVAAFLAALAVETGNARFAATASSALRHAIEYSTVPWQGGIPGSLFEGRLGVLSLGLSLARSLGDQELCAIYEAEVPDLVAKLEPVPEDIDFMHGAAGSIIALVHLSNLMGGDPSVFCEKAKAMGEVLCSSALKTPAGWHWPLDDTDLGLCGLSHGNTGIALAFAILRTIDTSDRWQTAIDESLRYEDHWFREAAQNWPYLFPEDAKSLEDQPTSCGMAWCHGAPGIALARLALWHVTGDDRHRQVALTALNTTLKDLTSRDSECGASPTLCHGRAGNADILISAAKLLGEPNWLNAARAEAVNLLARYGGQATDWPSGLGVSTGALEGLMLGRAGTGSFLLRAARPSVGSFLLPLVQGSF